MPSVPVSSYRRVAVSAWDCLSAAGSAHATWQAISTAHTALQDEPGIGRCGRTGTTCLMDLAERAAQGPRRQLGDDPWPAFACAVSKGDLGALATALAGSPTAFSAFPPWASTSTLARRLGIRFHLPVPSVAACSTGLTTLLAAADLVEAGLTGKALVGAADASLTPLVMAGFSALGVLCGHQEPGAGRGFAPAEGAGFTTLGTDGPWRLTAGVRLADAGHETGWRHPEIVTAACVGLWSRCPDPDLIIVHGTGTITGDAAEATALADGPWRSRPRIACKPLIGHCLGASGIVELCAALQAPVQRLWKLSLGFGGHLAAVALQRA